MAFSQIDVLQRQIDQHPVSGLFHNEVVSVIVPSNPIRSLGKVLSAMLYAVLMLNELHSAS